MNPTIVDAINHRHLLSFMYHGYGRVVEPHAYGRDRTDIEILSAWQISGKPLDSPDWRLFLIHEITALQVLEQQIAGPRRGYQRNARNMTTVYAQLQPAAL